MQRIFPRFYVYLCLLIGIVGLLPSEMPWGPDADLASGSISCCERAPTEAAKIGISLIRFHQEIISPADGPRSHFIPSSSQYTLDAMRKFGFLKGFVMGCDRLMRENDDPWLYKTIVDENGFTMKYDPIQ